MPREIMAEGTGQSPENESIGYRPDPDSKGILATATPEVAEATRKAKEGIDPNFSQEEFNQKVAAETITDPITGEQLRPIGGGASIIYHTPDEVAKIEEAEFIKVGAQRKMALEEQGLAGPNFRATYERAKANDANLPDFNPAWQSVDDLDPEVGRRVSAYTEYARNIAHQPPVTKGGDFIGSYNDIARRFGLRVTGAGFNPQDVNDLELQEQEIYKREMGIQDLIDLAIKNNKNPYPGSNLEAILEEDIKKGMGGDLVRAEVEKLLVGEEYDDTKQMKQETVGALLQAITQYLTKDISLQQELRVMVYTRIKLHGATILARYVGLDKLAGQMTDFYQDEMRVLMDTKLFKEATIMLESENGAYFRDGKGFGKTKDKEYERSKGKRYDQKTIKMALLLMPNLLHEHAWTKDSDLGGETRKVPYCGFGREEIIEVTRRIAERSNIEGKYVSIDDVLDEFEHKGLFSSQERSRAKVKELLSESFLRRSGFSYEDAATAFGLKESMDKASQKRTSIETVVDMLSRTGKIGRIQHNEQGQSMLMAYSAEEQTKLISLLNEANRAFGLAIKVFDIFGESARYDGLINKQTGEYIRIDAELKLPKEITVQHMLDNKYFKLLVGRNLPGIRTKYPNYNFDNLPADEEKKILWEIEDELETEAGARLAKNIIEPVMEQYTNQGLNLLDVKDFKGERDAILGVIRSKEEKEIRYTQARAVRRFNIAHSDEIDPEGSARGSGAYRYKIILWNQIYLEGINKDTPGKTFLRRYASTDAVSLVQATARKSVLDQMGHWDDDFRKMQKHSEGLIISKNLKDNLTEGDPALFNSTSKLQDPVEAMRKIKDYLNDWSQVQRSEYMNDVFEGPLIYLAKYNKENHGFRNADIVRIMNLADDMVYGGVMGNSKKEDIEGKLYSNKYWAQTWYTYRKSGLWKAILGLLQDIFKHSVSDK